MKIRAAVLLATLAVFVGSDAAAQQAAEPVPLPKVTVEAAKKKSAKPAAKKSNTKQVAKKAAPQPAPAVAVPPSDVDGANATGETALGPVDGYVATRSATGTKTDTPLIEVPRTVNVVTRDQIDAQKPQSVKEALGYTPAVQNQTSASSIFDNISVRGFTAPIFLDGLRLPSDFSLGFSRIRLEPYNLERLEVLKGPASGLFGQSPPGGLINAVSKRPQLTPHNETFVQYGTDNYKAAGFDFAGPIDPGKVLSYRVAGLVRDTDLDFDSADRQRYTIAPSLTIRPSPDTALTLLGSLQRDSGFGPHQFVPLELTKKSTAPFGRISRSRYLGEPSFDDYEEDQWQIGYALEHRFNSVIQVRQNVRYSESDMDLAALRASGQLNPFVPPNLPPDDRTIVRNAATVNADAQAFQADTQVQADFATGALRHVVLAGVDFIDGRGSSLFKTGTAPTIDAYAPVYGVAIPAPTRFNTDADGTFQQTGIYVQDQIKLGHWIATLSLRHDWAETEVEDHRTSGPPFLPVVPNLTIKDDAWTGSAGLSYVFDNGLAPYFSYSTSFQPVSGVQIVDEN